MAARPTSTESQTANLPAIGALLALGLDAALLGVAAWAVVSGVSEAWAVVLAGTVGMVVAPFLGWRLANRAARRSDEGWSRDALEVVFLVDGVLVGAWIFEGFVGDTVVVPSPQLIAYKVLMGALATFVLSVAVAVPLGLMWAWLLRRASPRRP